MAHPAPTDPAVPERWTAEQYLRLVDEGVLGPEDRVELLEGVIVAMAPQNEPHAAGVRRVGQALYRAVGDRAVVQVQLALVSGHRSVLEPDAAVLPGAVGDYDRAHPSTALLVVEVSDTSLKQDRLTKRGIYAAAGIPEYWIVNVRDDCVEVRRRPEPGARRYASTAVARRGERIELVALPGAAVTVDDLLPFRAAHAEG
jgi:Uma2 family endonuclease